MAICKGSIVSMSKVVGTVIAVDYSTKVVVVKKLDGGICACPMSAVTVVSYEEVE